MSRNDLGKKALGGASLTVAGRLFRALQGIAALAILSRYLTPAEFGIMSLVAFVGGLAQVFTDFGTRIALVQRQDVTPLDEYSVFWWNLGVGAVLTALIMIFAPQIAGLMGDDRVAVPLMWVAPIFLIGAVQGVSLSVLERRLAFGRITAAEVSAALSGSVAAVVMVLLGFKLEALIAQQIVSVLVSATILVGAARWWPKFRFSFDALKPLLSYGSYVTAAGIVQILSAQADRPIVGNRLSATDLGYTRMAEQIVFSPLRITVQMVRKVMFPIMATIQQDDVRMRRGYIAMQHGLMVIMAPIAFGLWAVAEPVVGLLLGASWEMVAVLMGYLTIRSLFSTFNDLNNVIFSAKGWARFQFKWSIFSAVMTIGTLLLTVDYGIEAVVAGRLALAVLLTPLNSFFALRLISQSALEVVNVLIRPILAAFGMGMAVLWLQGWLAPQMGYGLQLLICIPVGGVLYLAGELLLDRARFVALVRLILARRKKG
ncbi:MAG: lipopolysaccharide biosynthesis protein [Paracoccaceae bacterium]